MPKSHYNPITVEERFWRKVKISDNGCWEWMAFTRYGYGRFGIASTKVVQAHVWAYQRYVGSYPQNWLLHHKCRNTRCVNPLHLEPLTASKHLKLSANASAVNRLKTHRSKGHLLSGKNVRIDGKGWRFCLECRRRISRESSKRLYKPRVRSKTICGNRGERVPVTFARPTQFELSL